MSTTIDINVTPTIQQVTINTVDNITVINVNTQSGGGGIESVTGTAVDNTDPDNPVINIPTLQEVLEEQGRMPLEINSNYNFQSSNKYQTIIVDTSNDIDLFMTDNIFNIGDEIEIYNKLSSDVEIRIIDIYASIIYYKNITIDGATLNRAKIPLYSKAWLKCVGTNVFNLVIQSQITIDATPTDGSSNAVSSNGVFDALALRKKVIVSDVTSATVTGTTSLTLAKTYEVTAGTLSASGFLNLFMYASRTGASNSYTMGIYINTSNNFGTATLITSIATSGNFSPFLPFKAQYVLKNNLLIGGISNQTSGSNYVNSITQVSVACNNTSNSVWLFIGITPTNSGSSIVVEGVEILN